jgi:hypothetical protein
MSMRKINLADMAPRVVKAPIFFKARNTRKLIALDN